MVEALNAATSDVSASWFCEDDLAHVNDLSSLVDVLVVARCRYSYLLDDLVSRARARGRRVVFDVDDLVFRADVAPLVAHTLAEERDRDGLWDYWYAYTGRIGAAMRLCDRVVVTNAFLAREAATYFDGDVRLVPNFMNASQLDISRRIYDDKVSAGMSRDSRVHLGYFSGTPSHNRDFELIADVLAHMLDLDERLRLIIVGYLELRGGILRHSARIDRYPLQDFLNLQRLVGQTEFNLVPLQVNRFTNCKSELKYFEAAAVGTITVASPAYTLAGAITDGANGFLSDSDEWEIVLERALATLDGNGREYTRMAADARAHSLEAYSGGRMADLIKAAVLED
jgi:glycosyltransferase involved in cell wall biosynthesis